MVSKYVKFDGNVWSSRLQGFPLAIEESEKVVVIEYDP